MVGIGKVTRRSSIVLGNLDFLLQAEQIAVDSFLENARREEGINDLKYGKVAETDQRKENLA